METIYLIIAIILMVTTIVLWVKSSKSKKTIKKYKEDISTFKLRVSHKEEHIINLNESLNKLYEAYSRIELDLQKNLRFKLENDEMAHNLKVKTVKDINGNVIGITSTIRRKVSGKYTEVPVIPFIQKPN